MNTYKTFVFLVFFFGVGIFTGCTNSSSSSALSKTGTSLSIDAGTLVSDQPMSQQGNIITITNAGTYTLSGSIKNGQIIVNAPKKEVTLLLKNATLTNTSSSAIYIQEAEKFTLQLAENSINTISDGVYTVGEGTDVPNAAVYSMADIDIEAGSSATLVVQGNTAGGIVSKDDIDIKGGTIKITAKNNGIRGKDSVDITNATLSIVSGGDGIESDNDSDPNKGTVTIVESTIDITAGGGDTVQKNDDISQKGIKATQSLIVKSGKITIASPDDALHSNNSLVIENGVLFLASGDDGMHGDASVVVNNGKITIAKAVEGIESKSITIAGGVIDMTTSDDGINVSGDSTTTTSHAGGMRGEQVLEGGIIDITGGTVVINAEGDGFDSNGNATMSGGTLIVNGPVQNGNGSVDVNGTFVVTGGTIIAVGSSGMAVGPSTNSSQNSMMIGFNTSQKAGTLISVFDSNNTPIVSFASKKSFQSFLFSSPILKQGNSYSIGLGGQSTGESLFGIYTSPNPNGYETNTHITLSSALTTSGLLGRGGMGGMPRNGNAQMIPPNITLPTGWESMSEAEKKAFMDTIFKNTTPMPQ